MNKLLRKALQLDIVCDSSEEKKRVIIVNTLLVIALFFSFCFMILDIILKMWGPFLGMCVFVPVLLFIYFLNRNKYYKSARVLIIVTSFIYFFANANFLLPGKLAEFFYLTILLMVMLLIDNFYVQLLSLLVLIIAFYIPNMILHLYPKEIFGYANMSVLFIGLFLSMRHFIVLNRNNEQKLKDDNKIIEKQNRQLAELQFFQQKFFVNISHEIRTPLTIINGNLNRISRADHKFTEAISKQTARVTKLLDDLIDLSKIDAGKLDLSLKPVNATALVKKVYQMFQSYFEDLELDLKIDFSGNNLWVHADEVYLERCFVNLVHNASKFTEKYGYVYLRLREENGTVFLTVDDSGTGISEKDKGAVFNRFVQLDNSKNINGTGVGLNFVYECMDLMNGKVEVESEVGVGTHFSLVLPKATGNIPEDIILDPKSSLQLNTKILLVDDNKEMLSYLYEVFSTQKIFTAENGEQALKILQEEEIDCVITDFMMPVMDGMELLKKIKESEQFNTSVIILTAKTDSDSKLSALRLGVDDYIHKPFIEEELVLKVKALVENKNSRLKIDTTGDNISRNVILPETRNVFLTQLQKAVDEEKDLQSFKTSDLAEKMNVSPSTLLRNVKILTGLTAKQYLKEAGMQRARKIFEENPETNIKNLARTAGMANQTYFTDEFEKRYGIKLRI